MARKDDGGPAFPYACRQYEAMEKCAMHQVNDADCREECESEGMSLRDWFAGQALVGNIVMGALCSALEKEPCEKAYEYGAPCLCEDGSWEQFAEYSYAIADAMLKEREK